MSGVGEGALALGEVDLDEDWDPVKYEVLKISALFYDTKHCVAVTTDTVS